MWLNYVPGFKEDISVTGRRIDGPPQFGDMQRAWQEFREDDWNEDFDNDYDYCYDAEDEIKDAVEVRVDPDYGTNFNPR